MAIIEGTSDNFEKEVLESKGKVLVDFNADWCGPCQILEPILEEFADENKDIKVISVNIDDEGILAEKYEVSSIPCLVLFEDGEEIRRTVGAMPKAKIGKFVK
jgi:thioredoxin 1